MKLQFEAWAESQHYNVETYNGLYISKITQGFWECWQASRNTCVVDLPGSFWQDYVNKNDVMDADRVVAAVEEAGLTCAK